MNTKLIIALALVGIIAVFAVGFASAQIATSTPSGTTVNGASNGGFFGWVGRCIDFRGAQYYGTNASAFQGLPSNITVTNPYTGATTTYQGYGYGPCMGRFLP